MYHITRWSECQCDNEDDEHDDWFLHKKATSQQSPWQHYESGSCFVDVYLEDQESICVVLANSYSLTLVITANKLMYVKRENRKVIIVLQVFSINNHKQYRVQYWDSIYMLVLTCVPWSRVSLTRRKYSAALPPKANFPLDDHVETLLVFILFQL